MDIVNAENIVGQEKREFKEIKPNYPLPTVLKGIGFFVRVIEEETAVKKQVLALAEKLYKEIEAKTPSLSVQKKIYE